MAIDALRECRQVQRNFSRLRVPRRHSPSAVLRVPVDRRLKLISLHRKQIAPRFLARPHEIQKFALPAKFLTGALIAHPHCVCPGLGSGLAERSSPLLVLLVHPITRLGRLMAELPRRHSINGQSAGVRHPRLAIRLANFGVTPRAGLASWLALGTLGLRLRRSPHARQRDKQQSGHYPLGPHDRWSFYSIPVQLRTSRAMSKRVSHPCRVFGDRACPEIVEGAGNLTLDARPAYYLYPPCQLRIQCSTTPPGA